MMTIEEHMPGTWVELIAAGDSGRLDTEDWPRTRAALRAFVRAARIEASAMPVDVEAFLATWREGTPDDYPCEDIFPSFRVYSKARRSVEKALTLAGGGARDAWDELFFKARAVGAPANDLKALTALRRRARLERLEPRNVGRAWAVGVDRPLRGTERLAFRAGVYALDRLHRIPAIASSGILPETIGFLPVYVNEQERVSLPSNLRSIYERFDAHKPTGAAGRTSLNRVWMLARHAEIFDADADPPAAALLDPHVWSRIEDADPATIGVDPSTMRVYLDRVRRLLHDDAGVIELRPKTPWRRLTDEIRRVSPGLTIFALSFVRRPAEQEGLGPADLDQAWAASRIAALDKEEARRFRSGLHIMNALRNLGEERLDRHLPREGFDLKALGGRSRRRRSARIAPTEVVSRGMV